MKKTNTNRIISSIIIAMMVVTSLIIPVSADETEATPTLPLVYQSSIGFTTESSTWGTDGVWSAEIYDKTSSPLVYQTMSATTDYYGENIFGHNGAQVFDKKLIPISGDKATMETNINQVATKTFTAPYDGHINISYATVEGATVDNKSGSPVNIVGLGKTQMNTNAIFRVTKTKTDGTKITLGSDIDCYTDASWITSPDTDDEQANPSIMVKKGDKIRFEAERVLGTETSDYHGFYCDPIITYNHIGDVAAATERNTFKSSEFFDATNNSGTWDGGVWSAYAIDNASDAETYATLMTTGNSLWFSGNLAAVNPIEIKPISGNSVTDADLNIGGAKVFTAPKSGTILISFADVTEANGTLINGVKKRAWNQAAKFRITKQSATGVAEKIYPNSADYLEAAKNSGDILVASNVIAKEVNVNQGDKINFEVFRTDKSNAWNGIYCDPIITYIPAAETRTVFQSSEYFNNTAGDGTWDGGVWAAQTLNPDDNKYTNLTLSANAGGWGADTSAAADLYVADTNMNNHVVGAYRMQPPANGQWASSDTRTHYAVKTFTAPKSGKITITSDNGGITPADGSKPKVRIRKGSADGSYSVLMEEAALGDPGVVFDTGSISTFVNEGDTIHFEIVRTMEYSYVNSDGVTKYRHAHVKAYWDPVITYFPAPAERNKFQSSEYFDTNGETAKWDSSVWQAWFYDWDDSTAENERAKYKLMVATKDNATHGTCFISNPGTVDYSWGNKAAYIGETYMIADTTSGLTQAEWQNIGRDYPVKVFTAPKSGVVTIDAALLAAVDGKNSTTGADNIDYFNIRIKKLNAETGEPVQIFPASGYFTKYGKLDQICEADFPAMQTYLAEGDMLLFEDVFRPSTLEGANGYSAYASALNWDPTVEYTTGTVIDKANIVFKSGEDTVTGVTNIATAANLTATIPVYSGTAFEKAIVVVGIYDSNDMLVRVGMSEDISISATEPNNVPVTFGAAASEIESGSIKVFLWEGLSSLAPVAAAMPIQ